MAQARVRTDSRYQTLYPQTRCSPGSPAAESPLRLAVPLIILLISGFLAGFVRRRRSDTPLLFFLAWVLTDGLLTLAIYGINFLGTF